MYSVVVPPDAKCEAYGVEPGLRAKLKQRQTWFDVEGGLITGFDYNLWASTSVGGFAMTKAEFVATLKYTLDQRLAGNRSPFLFGAHTDYYVASWNQNAAGTPSETDRRAAIEEFLDYAKTKQEVEITTYKHVLEYVRNPTVQPMMRMIVLPVAASVIYVLDGVLADLNRHLTIKLHEELRRPRPALRAASGSSHRASSSDERSASLSATAPLGALASCNRVGPSPWPTAVIMFGSTPREIRNCFSAIGAFPCARRTRAVLCLSVRIFEPRASVRSSLLARSLEAALRVEHSHQSRFTPLADPLVRSPRRRLVASSRQR